MTRVLDKQKVKQQEIESLRMTYTLALQELDKIEEAYTKEYSKYLLEKRRYAAIKKRYETIKRKTIRAWEDYNTAIE